MSTETVAPDAGKFLTAVERRKRTEIDMQVVRAQFLARVEALLDCAGPRFSHELDVLETLDEMHLVARRLPALEQAQAWIEDKYGKELGMQVSHEGRYTTIDWSRQQ